MNYMENYERWLHEPKLDADSRRELEAIAGDRDEIEMRFLGNLEFGTGGLRGTMGAGLNKMNVYTVAQATQGMAEMIALEGTDAMRRGVVIAYDSRNNSALFSETAAAVLSANGIAVYIFDGVRPTPELSFAIRHLGCIAGINITASHNPKQYNGYKAYWEDGAQLPPKHADIISDKIKSIDIFNGVKQDNYADAVKAGKIRVIGEEVDRVYLENVLAQRVNPDAVKQVADNLTVVYTPLHGAGYKLVPEALRASGLKKLYTVPEQMVLDGNFPTVVKPNPELPAAFTLGIKLADEVGSDLIIATDPDSDRMGAMTRTADGSFVTITGNQMASLLLDYIITALKETGGVPADAYAVKTIVSTELATAICRANGVKLYNVLTGFKFIGEVIKEHEAAGHGTFLFGFEESYGYLAGGYVRDKDAVVASMLICEMAAWYKGRGKNLGEALDDLYAQYGYYFNKVDSYTFPGSDGMEKMAVLMETLRTELPIAIAGRPVTGHTDYEAGKRYEDGEGETPTGLPASNVMEFRLGKEGSLVARPSGTEPKLKFYYSLRAADRPTAEKAYGEIKASVEDWLGL